MAERSLVLALVLTWSVAVGAQTRVEPKFRSALAVPPFAASIEAPFGLAIVAKLAAALAGTSDQTCVAERKLNAATWPKAARDLLAATHDALAALDSAVVDGHKADATFTAGGDDLVDLRLVRRPELAGVATALSNVAKDNLVNRAVEEFGRFSVIHRYRSLSVGPYYAGDTELLDLLEATAEALDTAVAAAPKALATRLLQQHEIVGATLLNPTVVDGQALAAWSVNDLQPALSPILAAICVTPTR